MKKILCCALLALGLSACNNYKQEDLYGSWTSKEMDYTFREDKSLDYRMGALSGKGRYRPFGNTLELVNSEEKVISRVSIKSLKNDSLVIDMPNIGSRIFTLTRVK